MACSTCGIGVPKAPGLGGGPMSKAALRDYWLSMPGVRNTGGVRLANPGPAGEYEPDRADAGEGARIAELLAAEPVLEQLEENPRSWLAPVPSDLAVVGLGWNASNLAAVAPFPMARTGYVQNPEACGNPPLGRRRRTPKRPRPGGGSKSAAPIEDILDSCRKCFNMKPPQACDYDGGCIPPSASNPAQLPVGIAAYESFIQRAPAVGPAMQSLANNPFGYVEARRAQNRARRFWQTPSPWGGGPQGALSSVQVNPAWPWVVGGLAVAGIAGAGAVAYAAAQPRLLASVSFASGSEPLPGGGGQVRPVYRERVAFTKTRGERPFCVKWVRSHRSAPMVDEPDVHVTMQEQCYASYWDARADYVALVEDAGGPAPGELPSDAEYPDPEINPAPPLPPGMGVTAVPFEPPGWSGMGQGCWRDDDCRRNEYCHAGLCVTSPWLGRGAGTQVELGRPGDLDNPAVGPLSVAMQATGQIPRVPRGARVSQADVFPARRRAQNPGGGAYQEFVHPLG